MVGNPKLEFKVSLALGFYTRVSGIPNSLFYMSPMRLPDLHLRVAQGPAAGYETWAERKPSWDSSPAAQIVQPCCYTARSQQRDLCHGLSAG